MSEPLPHYTRSGWIEVIVGSMFSGKSEELIRRLRRAQIARQKVQIFKPLIDDRYSADHIVSHSELRLEAEPASSAADLESKVVALEASLREGEEGLSELKIIEAGRKERAGSVKRANNPG